MIWLLVLFDVINSKLVIIINRVIYFNLIVLINIKFILYFGVCIVVVIMIVSMEVDVFNK